MKNHITKECKGNDKVTRLFVDCFYEMSEKGASYLEINKHPLEKNSSHLLSRLISEKGVRDIQINKYPLEKKQQSPTVTSYKRERLTYINNETSAYIKILLLR
jgi:hypothetical protein